DGRDGVTRLVGREGATGPLHEERRVQAVLAEGGAWGEGDLRRFARGDVTHHDDQGVVPELLLLEPAKQAGEGGVLLLQGDALQGLEAGAILVEEPAELGARPRPDGGELERGAARIDVPAVLEGRQLAGPLQGDVEGRMPAP